MKTLEEKIAIFNGWEEWRCAESEEYIYDLNKEDDYKLWASMYGDNTAERCKGMWPYWIGGGNYYANVVDRNSTCRDAIGIVGEMFAKEFMERCIDNAYLKSVLGGGWYWESRESRSEVLFDSEKECYDNMRDYALDMVISLTGYGLDTDCRIVFSKNKIIVNIDGREHKYEIKYEKTI